MEGQKFGGRSHNLSCHIFLPSSINFSKVYPYDQFEKCLENGLPKKITRINIKTPLLMNFIGCRLYSQDINTILYLLIFFQILKGFHSHMLAPVYSPQVTTCDTRSLKIIEIYIYVVCHTTYTNVRVLICNISYIKCTANKK